MAVKIVDEKPDPSIVKQKVCATCGVKVEYVPLDVQRRTTTDYTGGTDNVFFIECPKCKNEIHVRPEYHSGQK